MHRNCLLKHFTEGKTEGTRGQKEVVSSYWMAYEKILDIEREELDSTVRRTRLGKGY